MDICKSLNISVSTVMKNPEILKFVPDHLQTKKIFEHAVKKLPYLLRYVSDQLKTQQMCDKAIRKKWRNIKFCSWLLQKSRNV